MKFLIQHTGIRFEGMMMKLRVNSQVDKNKEQKKKKRPETPRRLRRRNIIETCCARNMKFLMKSCGNSCMMLR